MSDEQIDIDEAVEGGFFWNGKRLPDWSWLHREFYDRHSRGLGAMGATTLCLFTLSLKLDERERLRGDRSALLLGLEKFAKENGIDQRMSADGMEYSTGYISALAVVNRILTSVEMVAFKPDVPPGGEDTGPKT